MEQIIITHPDGSKMPLLSTGNISVVTRAEQTVALLADDTVNISVQSATPLQFIPGDTIEVYGKIYTLNQLPAVKKTGERRFTYDLTFEGVQYELLDAQFLLPDSTVGDSLTGSLEEFVQILVSNANRVFPDKWKAGEYPEETEYKTLTFTGENCLSVLQRICGEWGQEFVIEQTGGTRELHIRTAGKIFPYTFKYGRTGGLYELTRQNISSKNVVTRLFVYGGTNNLPNRYFTERNSNKLCLPDKNKSASFIQDEGAVSSFGLKENTKTFDDIFPNRYGEVGEVTDSLTFKDSNMPFDLKERDENGTLWLINGVSAKIHFNTGNLAGYEFDIDENGTGEWDEQNNSQVLKIVPFKDENGMEFPGQAGSAFQFTPGDKYFFTGINLPDEYITEAEDKLDRAGAEYYAQNSQPQVQYGLSIDEIFIKQFAGETPGEDLFSVGDYIPVLDTDMGVDKSVRITGFTRDLLRPYKYAITLGDAVTKSTYTRLIAGQKTVDQIIAINSLADPSRARRNWRAAQEVLSMVFDPEGDYYSGKIKPLSIETGMLQAGAKSTQFALQNVVFEPNSQGDPNYMRVSDGGFLVHYAIEETVRYWSIIGGGFSGLSGDLPYFIYARCPKSGNAGIIILDTAPRKVDHEANYYTFLIGVLNRVMTDTVGSRPARLISLTYGGSTINGRFIKTGRIESSGGRTAYFDLDNGEIGGRIKFTSAGGNLMDVSDLFDSLTDTQNYVNVALQDTLAELQNQIDGAIQYFFGAGEPTTGNYPANAWNSSEYDVHLGDIYTDTATGYEYRFTKNGDVYSWTQAASTGVGQALQIANDALDLAGGKNAVFVTAGVTTTPKAPYAAGDLWFTLNTSKFKVCRTANKNTGTYNAAHWVDAGYTDDTAANNALQKLTDMADDSIISPQEKIALKDEWMQIQSDYATIASQASLAGIGYADLTAAYSALATYINTTKAIFSNMNANTSIERTAFSGVFTGYYSERTKLVARISQAQVNALNIGGQNYIKNSAFFQNLSGWTLPTEKGEGALTLYSGSSTHGPVLRVTKTGSTGWWVFGTGMESAGGNICLPQGRFISGIVYTVAFYVYCSSSVTFYASIRNADGTNDVSGSHNFTTQSYQWQKVEFTFTANSASSNLSRLYIAVNSGSAIKTFSYAYFTKFVLCEGNKAPEWNGTDYSLQLATKYVTDAIKNGSTDHNGGLLLSNIIMLKETGDNGQVRSGMSGLANDNTGFWTGGTYQNALDGAAKCILRKDGSGQLLGGLFKFTPDNKLIINLENFKITEEGRVTIAGIVRQAKTIITPANISGYLVPDDSGFAYYRIDFEKCSYDIEFQGTFSSSQSNYFSVYISSDILYNGAVIKIKNKSNYAISFSGHAHSELNNVNGSTGSFNLHVSQQITMVAMPYIFEYKEIKRVEVSWYLEWKTI